LEYSVSSMVDLVGVAVDIVIDNDAVFLLPAFNLVFGALRLCSDTTKCEPQDREDSDPEELPPSLKYGFKSVDASSGE
jgi:hypothetical protein